MKKVLMVILLCFAGGYVFGQVVLAPSPGGLENVAQAPSWLIDLVSKFPKLSLFIFIVGGLRLTLKPLFAFAHQFFQAWGLKSFDQAETNIEQSKFFKAFYFVLDYLGSIKMPVAANPPPADSSNQPKS